MEAHAMQRASIQQRSVAVPSVGERYGGLLRNWSFKRLLADGARDWNFSPTFILVLWSIPVCIAAAGVLMALTSKDLYKWFTAEDRFAENMQVLFCSFSLLLGLLVAHHLWRAREHGIALLYYCFCLGLIFLIGEEIAWGQRLFGWQTPDALRSANEQGETTLHNIAGVHQGFKWIQLLIGAYGTFLPLALFSSRALVPYRRWLTRLVPHYTLIPYFAPLFVWKIYRNLDLSPVRHEFAMSRYNEVIELILYMGFFLFVVFQWRRLNRTRSPEPY
jgi:hypothetical protein